MKKLFSEIRSAVMVTLMLAIVCCGLYPLVVFGVAQIAFRDKANGSLIVDKDGTIHGSRLLGQQFTGEKYFQSRPSAAGNGYDAGNSGGSNLGPTNKLLVDRVNGDVQKLQAENPNMPVPMDLVTTSGSGLDPHISPEAAEFQVPSVARERHMTETDLRTLVANHTEGRQLGFLGEPRVNVLELNLDLDSAHPPH